MERISGPLNELAKAARAAGISPFQSPVMHHAPGADTASEAFFPGVGMGGGVPRPSQPSSESHSLLHKALPTSSPPLLLDPPSPTSTRPSLTDRAPSLSSHFRKPAHPADPIPPSTYPSSRPSSTPLPAPEAPVLADSALIRVGRGGGGHAVWEAGALGCPLDADDVAVAQPTSSSLPADPRAHPWLAEIGKKRRFQGEEKSPKRQMRNVPIPDWYATATAATSHTGLLGQRADGPILPTQANIPRRMGDVYALEDSDDEPLLSAVEAARALPSGKRRGIPEFERPLSASRERKTWAAALKEPNPQLRQERAFFLSKVHQLIAQGIM